MTQDREVLLVAVCTYHRNDALRVLLGALAKAAEPVRDRAAIGVVVVDDDAAEPARAVVEAFATRFELGVHYRVSGHQNISLARNVAIEAAAPLADWIAMTDDDCEPVSTWLAELLAVQRETGADVVTGPMHLRVPAGSPPWLQDQPFFSDQLFGFVDRQRVDTAATNNSLLRASFVRDHPEIRFRPELGVLGGEDMVFYRTAHRAGLNLVYAEHAAVWGNEPPERATLRHQLSYRFWLGNTEYVTNRALGDASPIRLFLRGAKGLVRALSRPVVRLARCERAQWRYALAASLRSLGLMLGPLGVRLRHH